MVTYSDMVTLLLVFFVLLLSFSNIDNARFERAMWSLQNALGLLESGQVLTPTEEQPLPRVPPRALRDARHQRQIQAMQRDQLMDAKRRLREKLSEADLLDEVSFEMSQRGLAMRFTDRVLFESGRAELKPEARDILDLLAPTLSDLPNHIRVEGHTDDVPIETDRFPSNWELSTARSTNVLRYLLKTGQLPPDEISAAGYGEFRPVTDNETEDGRSQNRRVDVVLLRLGASSSEPSQLESDPAVPREDTD